MMILHKRLAQAPFVAVPTYFSATTIVVSHEEALIMDTGVTTDYFLSYAMTEASPVRL